MNKYWFKPKIYGLGAYPSTWEGWALIAAFMALAFWRATKALENQLRFGIEMTIMTLVLIYISYIKTEGGWKWRWGNK